MAGETSGGGRGGMAWAILVLALAVPGVLFYHWWARLKVDREKAIAARARGRVPEGGVFQAAPGSNKLVNPMSPVPSTAAVAELSTQTSTTTPAAVAAAETTPALPPANTASAASADAAVGSAQAAPPAAVVAAADAVARAPAAAPGAAPATSAAVLISTQVLTVSRDPMLSPFDLRRQREEELNRLEAERKLQEAKSGAKKRAPVVRTVSPESLIDLQGVIESPDGQNKAIVNNEVVGVGDMIGKSKIVRITADGVTFLNSGRRFTKNVNRE